MHPFGISFSVSCPTDQSPASAPPLLGNPLCLLPFQAPDCAFSPHQHWDLWKQTTSFICLQILAGCPKLLCPSSEMALFCGG